VARAALAQATGHHKLNQEHLRDLDNDMYPFFSLMVAETGHRKWLMGRRLSRFLKMAGAAYSVAPAPMAVPAVVVTMGGCPPSSNLTREALIRWVDSVSSGGLWRLGFMHSKAGSNSIWTVSGSQHACDMVASLSRGQGNAGGVSATRRQQLRFPPSSVGLGRVNCFSQVKAKPLTWVGLGNDGLGSRPKALHF
jgi:hypothetical protein